ncbi:MAG: GNAT family N-acetyltransferase [Caulobacteraceae bacterium]|nr:GNAT family N-acetyltransferase [Caulobacteraceae bacterium]
MNPAHDRAGFHCENPTLTEYFQKFAGQNERNLAACFVALGEGGRVHGYYTLSTHAVLRDELSDDQTKGLPRHDRVPAFLIGRLARDLSARGQGVGELLLMDAFARLASTDAAGRMVVVDPIDDNARAFYVRFGFQPLGRAIARLYLSMKAVRQAMA